MKYTKAMPSNTSIAVSMGFDDPMPSPFTSSGIVLGGVGFSVTGSEGGVDGALGSAEAAFLIL